MKFLEDMFWEMGSTGRWKREQRRERKECSEGRHKMRERSKDLPSFYGKYICCERWQCGFAVENPDYSDIKMEWWRRKKRAEKKAKQAAGALVCAVRGHDMEYLPPPDWMGWCRRCGYCP